MKRINFKDVRKLTDMVLSLDEALIAMQSDAASQEDEIRSAADDIWSKEALDSLAQVPVEELRNSKAGIRVKALADAGYRNLKDLALADDNALQAVSGIGEKQTISIRAIIAVFRKQLSGNKTIRLSVEDDSEQNLRLIRAIAAYRMGQVIREDSAQVQEEFHTASQEILSRITVRGPLKWLFTGRSRKKSVIAAIEDLTQFASSALYERAGRLNSRYHELTHPGNEDAKQDFEHNGAQYYVILEKVTGTAGVSSAAVSNIPADLVAQIDAFQRNPGCFTGSLRAYQEFGVKYILHQKRVLLGDDMGLGKTIQAIAAMADLYAQTQDSHFLVICPASVLINWCREIRRFSTMNAWMVHGDGLEHEFRRWQEQGGVAVTNYESLGKIIGRINRPSLKFFSGDSKSAEGMELRMLVIDEAHYIKNPEALRTQYVRLLDDESENILLMTGTPLENHVDEMCSLIDFIRPDLSEKVRSAASLSKTKEFRQMISPVYLRRRREEVLQELPPADVKEEWCRMSEADRAAYAKEILAGNFTGARRIGFLQEDMNGSSKAQRLGEICAEAQRAGRKVIVYSFFRETLRKVEEFLCERCAGTITGSTSPEDRQRIVDAFTASPEGSVLICQVQAGGTGLNIQAASIVIFCEPQIKPSLIHQAVARAWRMGQVRNVQVYHLLCEDSVDEAVMERLEDKQLQFELYADESYIAQAADEVLDKEWIQAFMEKEHRRYLPAVIPHRSE